MVNYLPYLDWLKSQENEMLRLVEVWANINSFSHHPKGLKQLLSEIKHSFVKLEGEMIEIPLSPQKLTNMQGQETTHELGKAISIRKRPEAPIQVLLAGHIDTVYPPSSEFQKCERISSENLRGPGVTDMKGGVVILLKVLEALERTPFASQIGWEVLLNPDEEIGSPGSGLLFRERANKYRLGLIFEPALPEGGLVSARKGSATYTVIAKGRSAHVGRDPKSGRNAVHAIAHLVHLLETMNSETVSLHVGHISGGGVVNVVPDLASCRFNFRAKTKNEMEKVRAQIKKWTEEIGQTREVQLQLVEESFRFPKEKDAKMERLMTSYQNCALSMGCKVIWQETGGATDGNLLAAEGLATLDSLGARGDKIHTHEENLFIPSLVLNAQRTALFLFKIATGEIEL